MSENAIQKEMIDALRSIGAFAFRAQSGKVKVRGGWMQLCPAGTPDILVVVPPLGMLLCIEVKTAKGEERESQLAWAHRARGLGAGVETCRTVDEAVSAYLAAKARYAPTSAEQLGELRKYQAALEAIADPENAHFNIHRAHFIAREALGRK